MSFSTTLSIGSAGFPIAFALLLALGGPATAGSDLYAPVQSRYRTTCTNAPTPTTTRRVCDSRGICRTVTIQGSRRGNCRIEPR